MHSSSIACRSSAASPPAANFSRASFRRSGRRKLPTWSARNGGLDIGSSQKTIEMTARSCHAARDFGNPAVGASAPNGEESSKQRRRLALADAAVDLRRVVAGRLTKKTRTMIDGAAFWVGRAIIEAAQAGKGNRAGAHRAGLERHVKVAADEPVGADRRGGRTDGEKLGVCGRVGELAGAVAGARDNGAVACESGADRRLAARIRRPRLGKGEAHRITGVIHILPPLKAARFVFHMARPGLRA